MANTQGQLKKQIEKLRALKDRYSQEYPANELGATLSMIDRQIRQLVQELADLEMDDIVAGG